VRPKVAPRHARSVRLSLTSLRCIAVSNRPCDRNHRSGGRLAEGREATLLDDLFLETLDKRDHVALFHLGAWGHYTRMLIVPLPAAIGVLLKLLHHLKQ